jgi:hypothetical protein
MDIFTEKEKKYLATYSYTKPLVDNYNRLEEYIIENNSLSMSAYFEEVIHRSNIQIRYGECLEENPVPPKSDASIADSVDKLVALYTNPRNQEYYMQQNIYHREIELLIRILYKYAAVFTSSLQETEVYKSMHALFLKPLFRHPVFRTHLVNPLVMRFVFLCTIHCTSPDESNPTHDDQLDAFYGAILKTGRKLYWNFLREQAEKTATYKEELIAAAWHPKRVEKWLEVGGFELLDALC